MKTNKKCQKLIAEALAEQSKNYNIVAKTNTAVVAGGVGIGLAVTAIANIVSLRKKNKLGQEGIKELDETCSRAIDLIERVNKHMNSFDDDDFYDDFEEEEDFTEVPPQTQTSQTQQTSK